MLGFQAETGAVAVSLTALPVDRAIKEVSAVKLDARLGSQHFQDSSADRLEYRSRRLQLSMLVTPQHPVVIVTPSEFKLLVVLIYS